MAAARGSKPSKPPERRGRRLPSYVVGLGASAGGLEAFEQFFASTATSTGAAFVLVTHLDPDHKALLAELVQRTTAMPVREIADGMRLAPDSVYVIPPNRALSLEQDVLRLGPAAPRGLRAPIDTFFRSLAHERGPTAIGVVLSGMGADGAAGLRAIKEAGGAVLVQDPASAAFDAMPRAALDAVAPDAIAAPELLPLHLAALTADPRAPAPAAVPREPDPALARVLDLLRRGTGHDLSQYKPSTIERRIERRLTVHRLTTLAAYADHVAANPEEVELLFRELLIGVTHFFRDEEFFLVLRDVALPALLAAPRAARGLRAWVAGCSSGEEAYSLAIILHELKHGRHDDVPVQIYATDLDKNAIAHARAGRYPEDIAAHVSPERLARYFTHEDHTYRIRKEIRDTVVFAQHDLISDPPFTRLDLLCCRNVMIYMQPALQQKLLARFHYALDDGGLLVLGASETTTSAPDLFAPFDAKAKVFRSIGGVRRPRAPIELPPSARRDPAPAGATRGGAELTMVDAARRSIVEQVAPPTVVINERGDILYSSRRTGRYLEPAVGKTNINIFAMAREGLGPPLSLAVRQAIARRRRVKRDGLVVHGDRGRHLVDVTVLPVDDPIALRGLLLVVFEDAPAAAKVTRGRAAPAGRKGSATIERELARTKEHLQAVIREMETAQAQIETSNEELQSTNEELQSTNEELTTSKEELQSLNEELLTLNAEFQAKNEELSTANDDLRNLLNSTKIPTLFLDSALRVKRFTSEATRVAHLISSDVGRAITDITLAVDYQDLARDVAEVLDTLVFKEVQVAGLDGSSYTMRIHPYRTMDNMIDGVVVTFSDVTALRRAEEALAARHHDGVVARLLDRWPGLVWVRDLDEGRDAYLNDRAREWLRAAAGADFGALLHPEDVAEAGRWPERLGTLRDGEVISRQLRIRAADGVYRRFRDRESVLARSPTGTPTRVLAIMDDMAEPA